MLYCWLWREECLKLLCSFKEVTRRPWEAGLGNCSACPLDTVSSCAARYWWTSFPFAITIPDLSFMHPIHSFKESLGDSGPWWDLMSKSSQLELNTFGSWWCFTLGILSTSYLLSAGSCLWSLGTNLLMREKSLYGKQLTSVGSETILMLPLCSPAFLGVSVP